MKNLIKRFWPVIYIIFLWFLFSSPYFIKGLVPYSSTYQVSFFPPWSHYEQFWGPVKNNAMPDIHTQIYPWKKLTIDIYRSGDIPWWNPYSFSGNPHLANFQTAVLSPFNTIFFILPFIDAWSILVLLQPLLAGLCMYMLARQYKLSTTSSLLSSVCFMFCGFLVVWMAYATLAYAILFLPASIALVEKFLESKRYLFLILFSLTIPLSLFNGHFQTSLYMLLFIVAYLLWKLIERNNVRSIIFLGIAFFVGIILSLPQVLPTIQLYLYSVRSESFVSGGGIPFKYLITTIAPDFYGNPVTRNDWFGYYAEWASFVGIVPLLFACIAVINYRNKINKFYVFALVFVLILVIDSPVQAFIGSLKIPVLSTSNPSRIIVLYSFCMAVLAGFGFEYMQKIQNKRNIILPLVLLTVLTLVWLYLLIGKPLPSDKLVIAQRNLILPSALLIFCAAFFAVKRFIKKNVLYVSFFIVILLASFDSYRYVQKWMPFERKDLVYPDVPVISAIYKNIGYGRMFGNFGGETAVYYKIPSIEGYDPLYIGKYGEFLRAAATGEIVPAERSVAQVSRRGKYTDRVLDITGVTILFHPVSDTNQSWAYPVWDDNKRNSLVYSDNKFQLYKNNSALARAQLFYEYQIEKTSNILPVLFSEKFEYKKKLILEEKPKINTSSKDAKGKATIEVYSPQFIKISVESSSAGLLFLSDNYYPGWKARILKENKIEDVKIYRADYTFRAIVVPGGKSTVEFYYNPLGQAPSF